MKSLASSASSYYFSVCYNLSHGRVVAKKRRKKRRKKKRFTFMKNFWNMLHRMIKDEEIKLRFKRRINVPRDSLKELKEK